MNVNKPPMGWNSWNTFGTEINDSVVRESADAMVSTGLKAAGYEYVVIDDCWSKRQRDPETNKIVPDPEKFPKGMKDLSDYVHSKGLKFGMYSCCGVRTCADYPGSFDHEFLDAETFAEYGCDFLKYDNCFRPRSRDDSTILYHRMGTALTLCGRDILFSACNWGRDDVWSWARSAGIHMYRSTGDIFDNFKSFTDIAASQYPKLATSANNCFNDMDMLTVGMYGKGNVGTTGCDDNDYRTQFVLWCLASAPLMLGCDIRNMTPETLKLVTNKDLIAIDQDPDCRPPFRVSDSDGHRVAYAKRLSDGDFAVALFNFDEKTRGVNVYLNEMGITAASGYHLEMTDLFSGEHLTVRELIRLPVEAHGCRIFRAKAVR